MSEILALTRIGNPKLRKKARILSVNEIQSEEIKTLVNNMRYTLEKESYGVGLAAPQVGESVALSVIGIKPTPTRPDQEVFNTTLINPEIVESIGKAVPKWEACISCGSGDDLLYAQVPRFEEIRLKWLDETGASREEVLGGFVAHVVQHETDHLNGTMFVDHADTSTYMMADEYRLRVAGKA